MVSCMLEEFANEEEEDNIVMNSNFVCTRYESVSEELQSIERFVNQAANDDLIQQLGLLPVYGVLLEKVRHCTERALVSDACLEDMNFERNFDESDQMGLRVSFA
jgi:hypothetical protein